MKKPILNIGDVVYVEWDDHYTDHDEWTDVSSVGEQEPIIVKTAGFLVKETQRSYTISLLMYQDNKVFASSVVVLKACVIKIKKLRV